MENNKNFKKFILEIGLKLINFLLIYIYKNNIFLINSYSATNLAKTVAKTSYSLLEYLHGMQGKYWYERD